MCVTHPSCHFCTVYTISVVEGCCYCTGTRTGGWPALNVILGNNDLSVICNSSVTLQTDIGLQHDKQLSDSGLSLKTILYQNQLQGCISQLADITSIGFQAVHGAGQVSFCLDQVQLLPSTMQGEWMLLMLKR